MTLRRFLRIIIRSRSPEWTHVDGTLSLKSYPEIRIEREDGGQDYRAPWILPQDGPSPFLFMYAYWYGDRFVIAFPVVQIDPSLVIPIPHQTETGYAITSIQYHLARLINLESCNLDGYLNDRAIAIVPAFGVGGADINARLRRPFDFSSIWLPRLLPSFRRLLRIRTLPSLRR